MPNAKRALRVFLCHASGDKPAVQNLYNRLIADGIDAWLDKEKLIPGQNWQTEISQAVRESDAVIVCLSQQSVTKEGFVQREIKFALDIAEEKPDSTIFIIPARLEMCNVPERINKFHWVDLYSADGYEWLIKALRIRADSVGATIRHKKNSAKPSQTPKKEDMLIANSQPDSTHIDNKIYVQEVKDKSESLQNIQKKSNQYSFLTFITAFALNFIIGIGLFSLDKQAKRKWIYPLAIVVAYFGYMLSSGVSSDWQLITLNFIFITWGISFVDIIYTWSRNRKRI